MAAVSSFVSEIRSSASMVARVSQEVVDGNGVHGGCQGTYMLLRWRGEKEISRNRDRGADFAHTLESGHRSRKRGCTRLTSGTLSSAKEIERGGRCVRPVQELGRPACWAANGGGAELGFSWGGFRGLRQTGKPSLFLYFFISFHIPFQKRL